MPDFGALYQRPAGLAKRPPLLFPDDYRGIISGAHSDGERNNADKTPIIWWPLKLTDWGPSVPESWEVYDQAENKMVTIERADIDLSARPAMRAEFPFSDAALVYLDDFFRSCGIEMDGSAPYSEYLPQVVGKEVVVSIAQYTNKNTMVVSNIVNRVVGAR